jgi:hypothetical protein
MSDDQPVSFERQDGIDEARVEISYRQVVGERPVTGTTTLVLLERTPGKVDYHFDELWETAGRRPDKRREMRASWILQNHDQGQAARHTRSESLVGGSPRRRHVGRSIASGAFSWEGPCIFPGSGPV